MTTPTRRTLCVIATVVGTAWGETAFANNQIEGPAPPGATISAGGICPTAETTSEAVTSLIPRGGVGALPPSARIEITDLGDSYRVTLMTEGKERVRVYRDVARDCDQRARFVAVFIVLTLMPPELLVESPLRGAAPPPPPPVPPPVLPVVDAVAVARVPPPPPPRFRLELAAALDVAPALADAPGISSPGVELRFAAGRGRLGATAGIGLEPRSDFSVGGLEVRELRVPFDVGARLRAALGPFELAAEAGLAAAIFHAEGVNPVVPASGTRLDIGARAAAALRLARPSARLAPAVGLHALYYPKPYELGTSPGGVVGHMPSLWLGATAGISMSF